MKGRKTMSTNITVQDYERAERDLIREEARRGFRAHAIAYTVVNAILLVLNLLVIRFTDDNAYWFMFPLVGWGIGLTMHYVFGVRQLEAQITERQARIEKRAEHA
jgi:hypothetical protein